MRAELDELVKVKQDYRQRPKGRPILTRESALRCCLQTQSSSAIRCSYNYLLASANPFGLKNPGTRVFVPT